MVADPHRPARGARRGRARVVALDLAEVVEVGPVLTPTPAATPDYRAELEALMKFVNYDLAVVGPGIIQDPSVRIMAGAQSAAHASEQATAVSNAGGMVAGKVIGETGKVLR